MTAVMEKPIDEILAKAIPEKLPIEDMPLNNIRDYRLYNEEARRLNKKLKVLRYPIKQCPEELHPKQKAIFSRNDGSANPIPCHLSNEHIHYHKTFELGQVYEVPECVIHQINEKGYNHYKKIVEASGKTKTVFSHKEPRFSVRTIFSGN